LQKYLEERNKLTNTFYKLQYRRDICGLGEWQDSVVYNNYDTEQKARDETQRRAFPATSYRVVRVTTTEEVLD
jgi:hypothetical protein